MSETQTLSKKDIIEIVQALGENNRQQMIELIQEMQKPKPPTQQEQAELQMAQQHRKDTAEGIIRRKENDRYFQEHTCTHEHTKASGGGTHCVHVRDNDYPGSPGYILCQFCQGRFRPESDEWRKLDPEAIFSTPVFNKLFQDCAQGQGEIIG